MFGESGGAIKCKGVGLVDGVVVVAEPFGPQVVSQSAVVWPMASSVTGALALIKANPCRPSKSA